MNILELTQLSYAWPGESPLWRNVSLAVCHGENIGLMGVNGSGKTTLFRCISGLLRVSTGVLRLEGQIVATEKDFQQLRRVVGFALQQAEEQLIFPEVEEDVCFGPLNLGLNTRAARERARESLELLGISHLAKRHTFRLSGGEQRLVALAGILAMKPEVLLMDEPLTGLDENAIGRIGNILRRLPCAKVIAAHDAVFLRSLCSRVYTLTTEGLEINQE